MGLIASKKVSDLALEEGLVTEFVNSDQVSVGIISRMGDDGRSPDITLNIHTEEVQVLTELGRMFCEIVLVEHDYLQVI